jgi:hypothetical protein
LSGPRAAARAREVARVQHGRGQHRCLSHLTRAAALQYTDGGNAGIVEPERSDPEAGGAAYGIEVTKPEGSKVDVFLDKNYKLMRIASNADG